MTQYRPARVVVDLDALRTNVRVIAETIAPARLLVVVKADAYGHGAVPVSRAALDAGADQLGVALVEEALELRSAGIDAPVLVLSEPPRDAAAAVVDARLTPVVYTRAGVDALAEAVAERDAGPFPVHLKVDTGMHRVGCAPDEAIALAHQVASHRELVLEGAMTHLAVADEPHDPYTTRQLDCFDAVLAALGDAGLRPPVVHAANSAAALAFPRARFDLVRAGIACYGLAPSAALADVLPLQPVMRLEARVSHVKRLPAGSRLSYGLRYTLARDATVATVPVGYADGVPRNLADAGGSALVRGRRCPMAGTVTMDQLMLDCGDLPVEVGDEVVLLGRQGDEEVSALEWADRLGTIGYEIVCRVGRRLPRLHVP